MQRAKVFSFVCAGVFLLALAYHLGATSATAQGTGAAVVGIGGAGGDQHRVFMVVMGNGDTYTGDEGGSWRFTGNPLSGPTPAAQPTFGQLKAQYRK